MSLLAAAAEAAEAADKDSNIAPPSMSNDTATAAAAPHPSSSKDSLDPVQRNSSNSNDDDGDHSGLLRLRQGIGLLAVKSYSTGGLDVRLPTTTTTTSPAAAAADIVPLSLPVPLPLPSPSPPASPGSARSAPSTAASTPTALVPPPLFPRATAPAAFPLAASARRTTTATAASLGSRTGTGLRAGVRGGSTTGELKIPPSIQAKMAAMASRSSSSSSLSSNNSSSITSSSVAPPPFVRPSAAVLLSPSSRVSSAGPLSAATAQGLLLPTLGGIGFTGTGGGKAGASVGGMKKRRPGMTLSAMGSGSSNAVGTAGRSESSGSGGIGSGGGGNGERNGIRAGAGFMRPEEGGTPFSNFRKIVDPSGRLNFASKAVVHADGVDFSSGASFKIKMADFELYEELGKGNYGTVQKVWHKPTKVTMALKEIRLELDDSKLKTIITELDILHRATSPYIIDFYGAFFIESCVYYCMEYMDAGSLEIVAGCDVPEQVLSRVTRCMVEGLRFLKDELKIMHRDVKPTNVLINRKGAVKLCDFGVSGQLDRSLAKTNIGCQSYMAPERIKGESLGAPTSYTASSDVWSLGLSIIEFAIGHYPYPPETYSNVFAQLTAIVHGEPPTLGMEYSDVAREFVQGCLRKVARLRPSYADLLEHPFLKLDVGRDVDMVGWIGQALEYRAKNPRIIVPALA